MSKVAGPSRNGVHDPADDLPLPTRDIAAFSAGRLLQDRIIKAGDTVLFRLPSGDVRSLEVKANLAVNFGKFGQFNSDALIEQPYGLSYEIVDRSLRIIPPKPFEDLDETDATNELINDEKSVQPLTSEEIEQLKLQNAHAKDIINAQIQQHGNFALKTEYSKDKYRKRKEAKFSKSFTTLEPTLYNVCEYWFFKDPGRIREIRSDSLAQILSLANVHPGGRYVVIDDGGGIVVAGVLERLAGEGRVLAINNAESPPVYFVVNNMNFPDSFTGVLETMNWAYTDPEWNVDYYEEDNEESKNEKQRSRLEKRKRALEKITDLRDEFFSGGWDGLIISSEYEPYSIIEAVEGLLTGSANIVVHSPQIQILANVHVKLRQHSQYLAPNITEIFTRQYQVLPGRIHPLMTTSGSAGYILHAIKIYNDPNANAVEPPRKLARLAKRRRQQSNVASEGEGSGEYEPSPT